MQRNYIGWLFLIPALFLMAFVTLVPFVQVIDLSFRNYNLGSARQQIGEFVSLANYRYLMQQDSEFWHSLGLSLLFVIIVVPLEFLIGFGLALLFNREFRGKNIFVSLAVIPIMMAPAAVGLMWNLAVNNEFGILPYFLRNILGVSLENALLGSSTTAFLTIAIMDVWQWMPFMFLIMLAGLTGLPKDPYEAAQVDGATDLQIFRFLTMPILKPLMIVGLLLRTIDAFKTFDQVWILTGGGPGNATELATIYAYRTNFRMWNLGYGAAVALVIFFFVIVITAIFYNLTQKKEEVI